MQALKRATVTSEERHKVYKESNLPADDTSTTYEDRDAATLAAASVSRAIDSAEHFLAYRHLDVLELLSWPRYGIDQVGNYIALEQRNVQIINQHPSTDDYLKPWHVTQIHRNPAIRDLCCTGKVLSDDELRAFPYMLRFLQLYRILSCVCGQLLRVILHTTVSGRCLIDYVQTLVLDRVELEHSEIVYNIVKLVRKRKTRLRILSVRNTDLFAEDTAVQLGLLAEGWNDPNSVEASDDESLPSIGIYIFGDSEKEDPQSRRQRQVADPSTEKRKAKGRIGGTIKSDLDAEDEDKGIISVVGAQLGSQDQPTSHVMTSPQRNEWYQSAGHIFQYKFSPYWADVLAWYASNVTGVRIAFDAVLCRGPRHDKDWVAQAELRKGRDTVPTISYIEHAVATVALGSAGCAECGSAPEGLASFPSSPIPHLPLLSPPPRFDGCVRNAQRPPGVNVDDDFTGEGTSNCKRSNKASIDGSDRASLLVRCRDCVLDRWCQECRRWWCENCYPADLNLFYHSFSTSEKSETRSQTGMKVSMGLCVERCLVPQMMAGAGSGGMWG